MKKALLWKLFQEFQRVALPNEMTAAVQPPTANIPDASDLSLPIFLCHDETEFR
jgi:hypothetical protein